MLDDYNREGLGIEADLSLPAERVFRSLPQIIEWRGKPVAIRYDNGPEYISGKLAEWAQKQGVALRFIKLGKVQQNAYIERNIQADRYAWLSHDLFESIGQMQDYATRWLWICSNERPNIAPRCCYAQREEIHIGLALLLNPIKNRGITSSTNRQ